MKKIALLALTTLLVSCGGGDSESKPPLPDPLSVNDLLLEKFPPTTRIKTANPSRPPDPAGYGNGRNFSVWPVLEIVQFEPGNDAENSVEIQYLATYCRMGDAKESVQVASASSYSVGYLQEVVIETTAVPTIVVKPKQTTSYVVFTGTRGSGFLPVNASDQPTTCWTDATVKVSGRVAVRVATHYLNFVDWYSRTPVVMGHSDWRTSTADWLYLKTED